MEDNKFPVTQLIVGVVIPIIVAILSFLLVNLSLRKKESNKLYIQIELVRRELKSNLDLILRFLDLNTEYMKLKKQFLLKLPFSQDVLYNVLLKLKKISKDYIHFSGIIGEKPTCLAVNTQRIEALDREIAENEEKYYENTILEQKKQMKIANLQEQKELLVVEIKNNINRNIYKEFNGIQKYIQNSLMDGFIEKYNENDSRIIGLIYIYNTIKKFNELISPTKEDIAKLYKDLFIFEIDEDIINNFDEDEFDMFYEIDNVDHPMYYICKDFFKLLIAEEKINQFSFECFSSKWKAFSDDLVMLNESSLYISIINFYEKYEMFAQDGHDNKVISDLEAEALDKKCKEFVILINTIEDELNKKQKKIKKWCK